MKRLVVYFHYDGQGVVDIPCRLAVEAMEPWGRVIFVTNGTLDESGRNWLQTREIALIERPNVGLDVGAYRQVLLQLGREGLAAYDELILMNFTLAGPVCPLADMFRSMEARTGLDFWGLTRHYSMRSRRFGGHVPEHLQSHFLAVRASVFGQDIFWEYWRRMPLPRSYEESVSLHETRFTAHFANLGFQWDSYLDTEDLREVFVNPIMACPRELLGNRGCPFFKRRSFFTPYADELRRTDGNASAELEAYLREKTNYPVDALLGALLRSQPLSVLSQNLHWQYTVADNDAGGTVDLAAQGLCVVQTIPVPGDPVTQWYLAQSVQRAETMLSQAVALFREHPLLGVLSPALPPWPQLLHQCCKAWRAEQETLHKQFSVPLDDNPPPAPCAGWALLRDSAFPAGIPRLDGPADLWRLPLTAQQNGYYSATFESTLQASARGEQLGIYMRAAEQPGALAKQLGRLGKRALLH